MKQEKLEKLGKEKILESAGFGPGARDPDITVLSDGRMVVAWSEVLQQPTGEFDDVDGAIFARILNSNGTPLGDAIQLNDFEPFKQDSVQVVGLNDGSFAVGWTTSQTFGDSPVETDTFIRYFDGDGAPFADFKVDFEADTPTFEIPSSPQKLSEIVPLSENRIAVILEDIGGGGNTAKIYDVGGSLYATLQVPIDDIAQLADGNIVTAGVTAPPLPELGKVIALQLFDDRLFFPKNIEGIYDPVQFTVNGSLGQEKSTEHMQLAALANGGFVLGFIEQINDNNSNLSMVFMSDIGQIKVDDVLTPIRIPFDSQKAAFDMIGLSGGGVAVALTDSDGGSTSTGVDILLFDADGTLDIKLQASSTDTGNQGKPTLAEMDNGDITLVFEDLSGVADTLDSNTLRLVQFDVTGAQGRFEGSAGDDVLRGAGGNDRLLGLEGDDTLIGRKGDDVLRGGEGNDTLTGGAGRDSLRGGADNDVLDGSDGNDGLGGGDGNDRLNGSAGQDALAGGQGADRLNGGVGDDFLKGGQGDDILIGGKGADVFQFVRGRSGDDEINDFDAAEDSLMIDLRGAKTSLVEVRNGGGDTIVEFGDNSVRLLDVTLDESDITFLFL